MELIDKAAVVAEINITTSLQQEQPEPSNNLVDVDAVRDDFITEVYRVLDADPTNDRANAIINAFDSLPTVSQEQSELYKKDESLGSPDYERGFKHGRDYQTNILRRYNKDEVIAYLVKRGYPISTAGEIPTYQETFDMVKNAIEYSNKQEHQNLDEIRRECYWYNNGYLKGRQDAHIPARELGLPKFYDFQQEQPEVDLEKEYRNFVEDDAVYSKLVNNIVGKSIAKHFYKLGLKAQKGE